MIYQKHLKNMQRQPHCMKPSKYGAGTMSRTRDLLITSQLLYHLSYAGEILFYTTTGKPHLSYAGEIHFYTTTGKPHLSYAGKFFLMQNKSFARRSAILVKEETFRNAIL